MPATTPWRALGLAAAVCAVAASLVACGGQSGSAAATAQPTQLDWRYPAYTAPNDWQWQLPAHVPEPRVPTSNPMTAAKVDLGRYLFYDQRLSGDGSMSCASCHEQARGFAVGLARTKGITGEVHPRNANALINLAWQASYTSANPVLTTLEQQISNPVFGETPVEMGVNDHNVQQVLQRLVKASDVNYRAKFSAAFADAPAAEKGAITWNHVLQAISAFERTLVSFNSRYDQYVQHQTGLTAQEINGLKIFRAAQCAQCHQEPFFTDQAVSAQTRQLTLRFHNVGLYNLNGQGAYPQENLGALDLTNNLADMGAFRTPTLRNVAVTGPYGHDGSIATLEEAVDIFAGGGRNIRTGALAGDGRSNPHKSPLIQDRKLSAQDKADLVAFLKSLTDQGFLSNPAFGNPFKH